MLDPKQRWSPGFKQNVRNSRVKTTKALADSIQNTKATVFATISGVAYYKPNSTVYTEESKCESYDFLSSRVIFYTYNVIQVSLYLQLPRLTEIFRFTNMLLTKKELID